MIIYATVPACDITGQKFDPAVEGVAFIARGATGRYCEVLWGGPEELAKAKADNAVMTIEEAYAEIERRGDGYPDF